MKSRGGIRFISFPRFAAGPYSKLTQTPSLQQQYQEIAASLTGPIKSGRLLDIGTGPGRLLLEIYKMNPAVQLYGLDISQAMVELARKNLAGVTTELKVANACATGFEDDFFDAVTCSSYKHFYSRAQEEIDRGRDEMGRRFCAGSELPGCVALRNGLPPGNSLPAQSRAFTAPIWAGARAHIGRRGAWRASGWCMQIDLASLAGAGVNWGCTRFERILRLAAFAFPMA